MNQYDSYENAAVRVLDRHRFPLPWYVEEAPSCFVVRDHIGQAFAHFYRDDNPSATLLTPEEARRIAANIARLPLPFSDSHTASAVFHGKKGRPSLKAGVKFFAGPGLV